MYDKTTKLIPEVMLQPLDMKTENTSITDSIEEWDGSTDTQGLFTDVLTQLANDTTKFMRETMKEEVEKFRSDDLDYTSQLEEKWSTALIASEAMYIMTLEAAELYIEYVNKLEQDVLKEKYYTFTALWHLHGRALQQFLEVITLMKNGLADGAYARWRSMYEISVISSFIVNQGEVVARAFVESTASQASNEWARSSNLFNSKNKWISFNDIQKKCDIDTEVWRNQYILANKIIHASSEGTFGRLSNVGEGNYIPVGRSDYGLTTPAEHSAISLAQITAAFFTIHPSGDSLYSVKYINNWVDVIREEYFKMHDSLFPNEDKLWDDSFVSFMDY